MTLEQLTIHTVTLKKTYFLSVKLLKSLLFSCNLCNNISFECGEKAKIGLDVTQIAGRRMGKKSAASSHLLLRIFTKIRLTQYNFILKLQQRQRHTIGTVYRTTSDRSGNLLAFKRDFTFSSSANWSSHSSISSILAASNSSAGAWPLGFSWVWTRAWQRPQAVKYLAVSLNIRYSAEHGHRVRVYAQLAVD